MKTDRLLAILNILSEVDKITAPELARRLEVSRRTITRDIEALCQAGIPIVTAQGSGGGISVMDGYRLDKTVLSRQERETLRSGLEGLASVTKGDGLRNLLWKVAPGGDAVEESGGVFSIDLASHYGRSLPEKLNLLQAAIRQTKQVRFDYYSHKGVHSRTAQPVKLVFRWYEWYLQGYCTQRLEYRLFKLGRLWNLQVTDETFTPKPVPAEKRDYDRFLLQDRKEMVVLFHPSVKWRLVEGYGPDCYTVEPDGRLRFVFGYTTHAVVLAEILSYGAAAQVISPAELRDAVAEQAKKMSEIYQQNG